MKKYLTLFLAAMLACSLFAVPAMAEGTDNANTISEGEEPKSVETAPTEPKPTESVPATDPSQTTTPTPDPSEPSTEATQPKPCSHVYGDWTADEAAHGRKCTLCGYAESNAHTWASETIKVDPTCGEAGGVCKICTVCQGVLVTELIAPTGKHTYDNNCDEACNVCGTEREVTHTFGTGWQYSGKGHWHFCTVCGAAGEVKSHYPGPAATEEKEQICLTCGMVMMKKLEHAHKWEPQWSSDETGHWYACGNCTEKNEFSVHTYDDGCDPDCNDCSYIRNTLHQYREWFADDTSHWQECEFCGEKTQPEAHQLNQNDASETQCIICLQPVTVEHVHEFQPEWRYDEINHWKECSCGEKAEQTEHAWDEGTQKDGMISYACEVCRAEKLEEAPEKGFPWVILLAGGGVLVCAAGIAVCIVVGRKKGSFYR